MGQSDGVIPGGVDLKALYRLVGAPKAPEQRALSGLDDLLEAMHQVARGVVDFNAIEIGPDACRELVNLIDQGEAHRQAAEACSRLVDQARDERDGYLAKLSEVAAARDREQARADVAERELADERRQSDERERVSKAGIDRLCKANPTVYLPVGSVGESAALGVLREAMAHAKSGVDTVRLTGPALSVLLETLTSVVAQRDDLVKQLATVQNLLDGQDLNLSTTRKVAAAQSEQIRRLTAERDDLAARFADLSELILEDAGGEPPQHLHCCECEECQPPQRGCVVLNVYGGNVTVSL